MTADVDSAERPEVTAISLFSGAADCDSQVTEWFLLKPLKR